MGYSKKIIEIEDAKNRAGQYPYAWVSQMSELSLGAPSDINILWEELLEARFFSKEEELHIFKCEKEWKAVLVTDNGNSENELTRNYQIANKFRTAGKEIVVKDYLTADKDGQVFVELTRLCGIEGGPNDGE